MSEMGNLKFRQLSCAARLLSAAKGMRPEDVDLIEDLQSEPRTCKAGDTLLETGTEIRWTFVLRSGWVGRQRSVADGRRQTVNVYLPGDFFGGLLGFRRMALFDIVALTPVEYVRLELDQVREAIDANPRFALMMEWNVMRTLGIVSEQNVSLSLRSASRRVLHCLLEFWCRLLVVGDAREDGFDVPLTQAQLGEVCGISVVSTNRSLRDLRERNLIEMDGRKLRFCDVNDCIRFADFDPRFLDQFRPYSLDNSPTLQSMIG